MIYASLRSPFCTNYILVVIFDMGTVPLCPFASSLAPATENQLDDANGFRWLLQVHPSVKKSLWNRRGRQPNGGTASRGLHVAYALDLTKRGDRQIRGCFLCFVSNELYGEPPRRCCRGGLYLLSSTERLRRTVADIQNFYKVMGSTLSGVVSAYHTYDRGGLARIIDLEWQAQTGSRFRSLQVYCQSCCV